MIFLCSVCCIDGLLTLLPLLDKYLSQLSYHLFGKVCIQPPSWKLCYWFLFWMMIRRWRRRIVCHTMRVKKWAITLECKFYCISVVLVRDSALFHFSCVLNFLYHLGKKENWMEFFLNKYFPNKTKPSWKL